VSQTVKFRGQQLGDWLIKIQAAGQPLTPPVRRTGLWQGTAAVSGDSINFLYGRQIIVALSRDNPVALDQAVSLIQALQGLQGDLEIWPPAGYPDMTCEDWWLDQVGIPNVLDGFGGRFVQSLPLVFVGETAPDY